MPMRTLTPNELLETTRSVRKRLDFTRPVEREVLEECLALAQQAPTGSNIQGWHFLVVTNAAKRRTRRPVPKKLVFLQRETRGRPDG